MKKNLKIKRTLMLILCITTILLIINKSFATSEPIIINTNEYESIQTPTISGNNSSENTNTNTNTSGSNISTNTNNSSNNSARRYNNTNTSSVPQTGIEDYNIGILLIIAVASAMYAYKKIKDYNNL